MWFWFKTAVHKPMGDITTAMSIIYTICGRSNQPLLLYGLLSYGLEGLLLFYLLLIWVFVLLFYKYILDTQSSTQSYSFYMLGYFNLIREKIVFLLLQWTAMISTNNRSTMDEFITGRPNNESKCCLVQVQHWFKRYFWHTIKSLSLRHYCFLCLCHWVCTHTYIRAEDTNEVISALVLWFNLLALI